jgi:hypothetical protein
LQSTTTCRWPRSSAARIADRRNVDNHRRSLRPAESGRLQLHTKRYGHRPPKQVMRKESSSDELRDSTSRLARGNRTCCARPSLLTPRSDRCVSMSYNADIAIHPNLGSSRWRDATPVAAIRATSDTCNPNQRLLAMRTTRLAFLWIARSCAWRTTRCSTSPSDRLPPPIPHSAVEVARTTYGVPHIRGENLAALGFGEAYVQSEDYGARVALSLLRARGEMGGGLVATASPRISPGRVSRARGRGVTRRSRKGRGGSTRDSRQA